MDGRWLLNALMLKIERSFLISKQLENYRFPGSLFHSGAIDCISHSCLHSLVRMAAEVPGGEAE